MACVTPLKAYRGPGGRIYFDSRGGWSDRPLELPCGQCRFCRLERARSWALRAMHEAQLHPNNAFITLTYSDANLPPYGGLDVDHWKKFAKRWRKNHGPFRYLHCGEYGERTGRPHYHALIFGEDFSADRTWLNRSPHKQEWLSQRLEDCWGLGHARAGALTYQSAEYVARYCMKKLTAAPGTYSADSGDPILGPYERIDADTGEIISIRPPYVTMSRRPGLGARWFEQFHGDVYPCDQVVHDGRTFRPPRFYDEKLSEEALKQLKQKRRHKAQQRQKDLTPERLRDREEIAELQAQQHLRDKV